MNSNTMIIFVLCRTYMSRVAKTKKARILQRNHLNARHLPAQKNAYNTFRDAEKIEHLVNFFISSRVTYMTRSVSLVYMLSLTWGYRFVDFHT